MSRAFLVVLLSLLSLAVFSSASEAKEAVPAAPDPALEQRVMALAEELRCLVCQNQTLADSHAELAVDLRRQIREQVKAGRSDREVLDFMVARYGDFVLYRPPFKATTLFLWVGPFVLLVAAVAFLFAYLARRRRAAGAAALSAEEQARAAALLEGKGKP